MSPSKNKESNLSSRRRLSFPSNVTSQQGVLLECFQRQQQVISVQMFFETKAPSMTKLKEIAQTLGDRFERMRGIPWDLPDGQRVFKDVSSWSAALDVLVQSIPLEVDTKEQARIVLEQVKLKDMNLVENGVEIPLWRIYRVGNRSIVLTIDHAIGDGLSLASMLAVVGTESEDSTKPLPLEKVSPLFSVICKTTSLQRFVYRWAFLWIPNFLRCIKILKPMVSGPMDPINPLMPSGFGEALKTKKIHRIPADLYGTIYLCPLPVSLFKSLARADGKAMTINDVLVTSIGDTVRRYFKKVGYEGQGPIRFGTPLAVPIKSPDKYLHESEGLDQKFSPICHQLPLTSGKNDGSSFRDLLHHMHENFNLVKTSFVTSFMLAVMRLMGRLMKPSNMADEFKNAFGRSTFVWSNVPGPAMPVYIGGEKVTELQCLVSNPFCMMQTCSYDGMVYSSIQIDIRATTQCEKLAEAYLESMKAAISEILTGPEQVNALRTLQESASTHKPGPYLSPVSY